MANVFSVGPPSGGTLTTPRFLYSTEEQETLPEGMVIMIGAPVPAGEEAHHVGRWHSAAPSSLGVRTPPSAPRPAAARAKV